MHAKYFCKEVRTKQQHTSMTSQACKTSLLVGGTSTRTACPPSAGWACSCMRLSRSAIWSLPNCTPMPLLMTAAGTTISLDDKSGYTAHGAYSSAIVKATVARLIAVRSVGVRLMLQGQVHDCTDIFLNGRCRHAANGAKAILRSVYNIHGSQLVSHCKVRMYAFLKNKQRTAGIEHPHGQ